MCLFFSGTNILCKSVSTHPSMVLTHQHRFKEKLCKNVKSVSTHVKSVSTLVAVFQRSRVPSVSTQPPGQVDTLQKLFILRADGCHVSF
ncbi:hypothetical protein Taro_040323, partial [Colocasia esculenta]|nr:hypothetical protein [Colocasia esculenta]